MGPCVAAPCPPCAAALPTARQPPALLTGTRCPGWVLGTPPASAAPAPAAGTRCRAALGSLPAQRSARPWPPVTAELAAARQGCSCQCSSGSAGVIFLTFPVKAAFCLEIL